MTYGSGPSREVWKSVVSLDLVWSTINFVFAAKVFVQLLETPDVVLFAFMILNIQAGYLFWTRNEVRPIQPMGYPPSGAALDSGAAQSRWEDVLAVLFWAQVRPIQPMGCVPSGAALDLGAAQSRWGDVAAILSMLLVVFYQISADYVAGLGIPKAVAVLGALMCFVSCWSLGASFGVLPRYRGIRQTGAYGIVRHPIYTSIVVMEAGYIATHPTISNLILGLTVAATLLARIYFEERLLSKTAEYEKYMNSVRYRLIPGIW